MNCEQPYIEKGGAYGCGRCLPCRIQRRRIWTHRILLEAAEHESNAFVTLTYRDDNLPAGNSLLPCHVSSFIKRLRKRTDNRLRYYACGEYGETTGRPHYHIALFNYPGCDHGITRTERDVCCDGCAKVHAAWGHGQILLGTLERQSAEYIAGYTAKNYTAVQDHSDRHPPFNRMSNRPGIGAGMMHEVASTLLTHNLHKTLVDVPLALSYENNRQWPLGRYLRRHLRTLIGRPANAPEEVLQEISQELQTLRETAFTLQKSVKAQVLEKSLGKRIQMHARQRRKKREAV